MRAIACAAEEAGFSSLWVMDHFRQIPMFGPAWLDMLESYTTLAFIAAATERLRLGTLVTGITYRNVAHLGKIVATLDVLSGGRAMCGSDRGRLAPGTAAPRRMGSERYAAAVNAGTIGDQIGRFRALAGTTVRTAIVSLPDLGGTEAIERFAPVIAAFATRP